MADNTQIKFSLMHRPPLTISMITAILALIMASKSLLIDTMPIAQSLRDLIGGWFSWVLNFVTIIMGVLSIVLGVAPKNESISNTQNP
jgi:uncharacterized membrane protein YwaF